MQEGTFENNLASYKRKAQNSLSVANSRAAAAIQAKEEAERYLIASNALGGDWDFSKLKSFDLDLLIDIGFDQIDLSRHWDNELEVKEEDFDVEKEIKKIKKPKTKPGDLIHLGPHKLLCASSTEPKNLQRLLQLNGTSTLP